MRREEQRASTILNSMADDQALTPLISLVPGTSPPVLQGSLGHNLALGSLLIF